MLEVSTVGGNTDIAIHGTLSELAADTLTVIKAVHKELFDENPIDAVLFRKMITRAINDEELGVFRYDYDKKEGE